MFTVAPPPRLADPRAPCPGPTDHGPRWAHRHRGSTTRRDSAAPILTLTPLLAAARVAAPDADSNPAAALDVRHATTTTTATANDGPTIDASRGSHKDAVSTRTRQGLDTREDLPLDARFTTGALDSHRRGRSPAPRPFLQHDGAPRSHGHDHCSPTNACYDLTAVD